MNQGPGVRDHSLWASACSIEIRVHTVLFSLILLPFAFLIFPFLVFHIGASLVNLNLSADWQHWNGPSTRQGFSFLSDAQEITTAIALVLVTLWAAIARYRAVVQKLKSDVSGGRRYKNLVGDRGNALRTRIANYWSQLAMQSGPPPEVVWFPSAAILAQAMIHSNQPVVAVSAGLWERTDGGDPIAEIILLHELAHLSYGDPARFIRFKAVLDAATRTLAWLVRVLVLIVAFLMIHQLIANYSAHIRAGAILREEVMIAVIGLLGMSICPVAAAMIRRYVGMITALIELRADVRSAQWAGGPERFAELLSNHPLVHQSTLTDRARSMFSLKLTHLSETERLDLLSNPGRLLTPKVRYFFFSLMLVLLLPLNGLTPLFEGGILDLAAVATVAAALSASVSTMVMLGAGGGIRIPALRLLALSVCVVLFTAACQLNFYTLTYSMSTVAVGIGLPPSGSTESFWADMASAFHDIRGQLLNVWTGGRILLSFLVATMALIGLTLAAKRLAGAGGSVNSWCLVVIGTASGLGAVVDGYDPWRISFIEHTLPGRVFSGWAVLTPRLPGLRFALGPCLALASTLVLVAFKLSEDVIVRRMR